MALANREILEKYLRHRVPFPHLWCPGCGNGIALSALLRAVDALGWEKDALALVSGIGCAGRSSVYVDANTVHTAHGRALPFALGIKAARPALHVVAFMGDGDAVGIGGNHFIHACRRNADVTAVIINNGIYGMTGGQVSPTTPTGSRTATSTTGAVEPPFDIAALAVGAGATFVARSTTYHVREAEALLRRGLAHKGFSVVEIVSGCPTYFGRRNPPGDAVDMLKRQRDAALPVEESRALEDLSGRIVTGVLAERDAPEWTEALRGGQTP